MVIHKNKMYKWFNVEKVGFIFTKHTNHRRVFGSDVGNSHSKRFLVIPILCAIKDNVSSDCFDTFQNPEQENQDFWVFLFKNITQVYLLWKSLFCCICKYKAEKGKSWIKNTTYMATQRQMANVKLCFVLRKLSGHIIGK